MPGEKAPGPKSISALGMLSLQYRQRDPFTGLLVEIRKPGPFLLAGFPGPHGLHSSLWHFLICARLYICLVSLLSWEFIL